MTTSSDRSKQHSPERRRLLLGLAAAPVAACAATGTGANLRAETTAGAPAPARPTSDTVGPGPFPTEGMAAYASTGPLRPMQFQRRALGPKDVAIKLHYCGVCHSDIHTVRGDWGPIQYPLISSLSSSATRHTAGSAWVRRWTPSTSVR
ncbi:alcohol dehydrogenase catalytic domain-containing protein [Myxococcus virescens]|uniref:alcohol dehydrogenase catalytic domain-containing protein n=1 Tax=Myxococcus virescens TaxID=83456 RepID=UPI003DA37249